MKTLTANGSPAPTRQELRGTLLGGYRRLLAQKEQQLAVLVRAKTGQGRQLRLAVEIAALAERIEFEERRVYSVAPGVKIEFSPEPG